MLYARGKSLVEYVSIRENHNRSISKTLTCMTPVEFDELHQRAALDLARRWTPMQSTHPTKIAYEGRADAFFQTTACYGSTEPSLPENER